ncbi:hypothetical protein [Salinicoccus sp. YB14-2]|uniref:hypothetical protein n=1 Tax=Salinicoccus sp. YB14-2 TaxID=1572701 RepID=UPI00068D8563|nr:hypothetical protein [Salinicoccus sp. YB14-2]
MVITETLISAVILAVSAAFGSVIYMLMNDSVKSEKKKTLEALMSQFINLIIFIYIIKIILNLHIFLADPLAVLAYPSDSTVFYSAIVLTAFVIIYKNSKGKLDLKGFLDGMITLFLTSSMMYEFIYFLIYSDTSAFVYFLALAFIFLVFYVLYNRIIKKNLMITAVALWGVVIIILSAVYSTATVFDYTMRPWFAVLLAAGVILLILSAYGKFGEYDKKEVGR